MSTPHSFVVTGAGGHLGGAISDYLSLDPASQVLATTRNSQYSPAEVRPNRLHLAEIDLLRPADLQTLTNAIDDWLPGPFHVVNCVGYFEGYREICDTNLDTVRRVFEENVLTLFATAAGLIPLMRARGGGHFFAFSSHSVPEAYPLIGAFTAAKAAVESVIRSIANEYSRDNIVSHSLAIATVDTPKERQSRPLADTAGWIQPAQVCQFVRHIVENPCNVMNGNTLHLFNYSDAYFHQSFFDRIGRQTTSNSLENKAT